MKALSIPLKVTGMLGLVVILLAACLPGETAPSSEEIEAAIKTSVAQTVEAQGAIATSVALTVAVQEAEASAAMPTATSVPPTESAPPTLTPVVPTATPFTISGGNSSSGGSSGGSSSGGGSTTYAYACDIIHQRPIDNTKLKPNQGEVDVRFAILNTGTATWAKGLDLKILGSHGVIAYTTLELPNDLAPGEYWEIGPYDATIPSEPGHYVVDFALEGGWCYPYIAFDVVR